MRNNMMTALIQFVRKGNTEIRENPDRFLCGSARLSENLTTQSADL